MAKRSQEGQRKALFFKIRPSVTMVAGSVSVLEREMGPPFSNVPSSASGSHFYSLERIQGVPARPSLSPLSMYHVFQFDLRPLSLGSDHACLSLPPPPTHTPPAWNRTLLVSLSPRLQFWIRSNVANFVRLVLRLNLVLWFPLLQAFKRGDTTGKTQRTGIACVKLVKLDWNRCSCQTFSLRQNERHDQECLFSL